MRKQYSKSEIKELLDKIPYAERIISKKSNVVEEDDLLYIDNKLALIKHNGIWLPTLKVLLKELILPKVVVDMGAVKFVASGADIMRPGVRQIEDFKKDDFLVIVDENNGKPLAVGKAMFNSEDIREMKSGKCIQNIHYVGDRYWSM